MATEAETFQIEFDQALVQYGQWVTHTRSPYRDESGNEQAGFTRPLRALNLIPSTLMGSHWRSAGLSNLANPDDRDQWYAGGKANIWEGDTITMRLGRKPTYLLTLVKPFIVDDTVVLWAMTTMRTRLNG